jgi:hypothetical protein
MDAYLQKFPTDHSNNKMIKMQQTIQKTFKNCKYQPEREGYFHLATEISDPNFPTSKAFPQVM